MRSAGHSDCHINYNELLIGGQLLHLRGLKREWCVYNCVNRGKNKLDSSSFDHKANRDWVVYHTNITQHLKYHYKCKLAVTIEKKKNNLSRLIRKAK